MKNIKNVIFDLGGVLVDLDIDRCTAAFRELGMNRVADLINPCYPAEMIGRLERGDLSFHEAYLSYELRELKPSEAIFRKVIADSGIVPAQTLFIDDGQKNVDAAQALGFAVYKPAPGEDFGHLLEEITATK